MIKKSRLLMILLPVVSAVALTLLLYLVMGSRQFSSHQQITGLTVDFAENSISFSAGKIGTGDKIYFNAGQGTLPEGIAGAKRYFARKDAASDKIFLHSSETDAKSGRDTVELGSAGEGGFKLFIDSSFYVYSLLMERGPIQWATMFVSFWTASILAWKLFFTTKENRWRDHLPFPVEDTRISRGETGTFIDLIKNGADQIKNSLMGNRLVIGLENFRSHGKVQEVVDVLSVQSDIDSRESDNSYTMIKVFVATIPILGFIGTVYGIGTAVGGFGTTLEGAGDVDSIKSSLGGVTSGLSVAFDTTLLALVMSILLMIPLGSLQQFEEESLNEIDDYMNNKFVNLLHEDEDAGGDAAGVMREALEEQARETKTFFRDQIGELREQMPPIIAPLGEGQSAPEMQSALSQIQDLQREQVEMMAQTSTTISEHGTKMQEVLEANMGFLNNWGEQFTEHLRESQGAIVQSEGKVVEQLEGSSKALASETERVIGVYKEMGNEFATELTQFFEKSLRETQQKLAEHSGEEQARLETLLSRQEEATAGFSQAVKEGMEGLADSTARWQGNEAELLSLFERKAQENIDVMSGAFKVLVEKQTDLVQSTHAMKEEARRQTEVCQQLIPALAATAEKQIIETRQKLERDSETFQREMMDRHSALLGEMQEQSRQQSEILKEFHQSQKAERESLDRMTDRWGAIASTLDGMSAPAGPGSKRKWWQFG